MSLLHLLLVTRRFVSTAPWCVEEEGELLELPSEELASCNFKRFCRCVASRTAYDVASLQGRNFALGDAAQVECRTRGMSRSSSNHAVCGVWQQVRFILSYD